MRIIAMLATYNEERFIAGCLEHLFRQGVEAYLIDNCSTDQTVAIAEQYVGRGLIGIETLPRAGVFDLKQILLRKEALASSLDADWFIHMDADEIRLPPPSEEFLSHAIVKVDQQGFDAVNFLEFTFIPTKESPDHDHPDFQKTMRWYYPFLPRFPHRLNAWKRQSGRIELLWSGGHRVRFPGLRMYPQSFFMRHYLFLSKSHFISKYGTRTHAAEMVKARKHGWRAKLRPDLRSEMIKLPPSSTLRTYISDRELDPSNPRTKHIVVEMDITQPPLYNRFGIPNIVRRSYRFVKKIISLIFIAFSNNE